VSSSRWDSVWFLVVTASVLFYSPFNEIEDFSLLKKEKLVFSHYLLPWRFRHFTAVHFLKDITYIVRTNSFCMIMLHPTQKLQQKNSVLKNLIVFDLAPGDFLTFTKLNITF
jgi:hypothetical protein